MKRVLLSLLLLVTACTSQTAFGTCIGAFDEPNPKLIYKASTWNIVVGIIFIEMIIPPVVVLLDEIKCPIAYKVVEKPNT